MSGNHAGRARTTIPESSASAATPTMRVRAKDGLRSQPYGFAMVTEGLDMVLSPEGSCAPQGSDPIGVGGERAKMYNLSSSEGPLFAQYATEFTEIIKERGPNPLKLAKSKAA